MERMNDSVILLNYRMGCKGCAQRGKDSGHFLFGAS